VNDQDYQVPFPFNGTINKLTFNLRPVQLAEEDRGKMEEAFARAHD
jgi:arylsulfatase